MIQHDSHTKAVLIKIPIGPSVNKVYLPIRGRFVKSAEGRVYDNKINLYKTRHKKVLDKIKQEFQGSILCVDKYFVFHKKRLFCKDGSIKKIDVENFLKTTVDGLSTLIDIDDKMFRSGLVEALSCDNVDDEQMIVQITVHKPRSLKDLVIL